MAEKIAEKIQTVRPQTTRKRHFIFQILVILSAFGFGVLTILAKTNPFFPFDLIITKSIQSINFPGFVFLMRFLTELGYAPEEFLLPVLAAVFLIAVKLKKEALMLFLSAGGAVLISETIKRIVARPRPDGSIVIQVGEYLKHDSFPSGHVLFFIGFFGFLAYLIYIRMEKNLLTQTLTAILFLMILFIGVSRIYLGAHWFSDVLGSYLIGSVWLYIMIHLSSRFKN